MLSSDWLNMSLFPVRVNLHKKSTQNIMGKASLHVCGKFSVFQVYESFNKWMVLGLIRKIHLKNLKVTHSESKLQPSIQTKMKTGVSAACDVQLFSRTNLIYGN